MSIDPTTAQCAGNDTVFSWAAPPLKFGLGAADEIASELVGLTGTAPGRVLVVTDPGVRETGVPDRVADRIRAAGIDCELFDGVAVEPTDESVDRAVRWARESAWDAFVAIGGGSAIDTAKAVNLLTTHGGELLDFVTPPIGGGRIPEGPLKPLVAVPTTAGTGSEATPICVVDLLGRRLKAGISHARLRPALAVVDPLTTLSLPPEVTAASGMDVLSHALESYTCRWFDTRPAPEDPALRPSYCGANPISDVWCETALRLVGQNLRAAVHDGKDLTARHRMALAATAAGTGFANAGTHLPHANAYPIAGMAEGYRAAGYPEMPMVPHGQAVAATAPASFAWTFEADPERHLRAAELLGDRRPRAAVRAEGAEALPRVLRELMADIGMPRGLRDFGYTEEHLDALVEGTLQQTRQLAVAPREVGREAVLGIYRASL